MSRSRPQAQARSQGEDLEKLAVHYSASGDALIVTFSEETLRRALDRQAAKRAAGAAAAAGKEAPPSWLGGNMCARVDADALGVLAALFGDHYQNLMQVALVGQYSGAERVEAALPGSRSPGGARRIVAPAAGVPRRREVSLERPMADRGINRLRSSGPASSGAAAAGGARRAAVRQLWRHLRRARTECPHGTAAPDARRRT